MPGRDFALDETMARFQGRSDWISTIRSKPVPTGYKLFTVAADGYLPILGNVVTVSCRGSGVGVPESGTAIRIFRNKSTVQLKMSGARGKFNALMPHVARAVGWTLSSIGGVRDHPITGRYYATIDSRLVPTMVTR